VLRRSAKSDGWACLRGIYDRTINSTATYSLNRHSILISRGAASGLLRFGGSQTQDPEANVLTQILQKDSTPILKPDRVTVFVGG